MVITQLPESEATQILGGALLAITNVEATPANIDSNRLQAQSRSQYTWHQKWDQIKTNDSYAWTAYLGRPHYKQTHSNWWLC